MSHKPEGYQQAVILLNLFEIPANQTRFLQYRQQIAEYMSQQPGYISTVLLQSLNPKAKFRFVNVAVWASPRDFPVARISLETKQLALPKNMAFHPSFFQVVAGSIDDKGYEFHHKYLRKQIRSVILINAFEVASSQDSEFIQYWQRVSEYMRQQTGFISAVLHQNLNPKEKFGFVNVAVWSTSQDFQTASNSERFRQLSKGEEIVFYPSLYQVVTESNGIGGVKKVILTQNPE